MTIKAASIGHLAAKLTRVAASIALLAPLASVAVELKIDNAWARPAIEGESAPVYCDIASDSALKLVGATSSVAKSVAIVITETKDGLPTTKSVKSLDIAARSTTRLALHGNFLELREVRQTFGNGDMVPVTLEFVAPDGTRHNAMINALVRGVSRPVTQPTGTGKSDAFEPAAKSAR